MNLIMDTMAALASASGKLFFSPDPQTNENGDLAIYGNEPPLDTDTFPLSSIQIYPNPTSDFLFVKAQSGLLDYQLFDLNGRLVTEQQPSGAETRVDLSELPAALYFLRLQSEEGTRTYKIVKK